MEPIKPLKAKAYGSIPHLPNSRMGPADHHVSPGQARICCDKARDKHDLVIVQEKLDGSCTAVAKIQGQIIALGRAGYLAETSPYEQHQLFAQWVQDNQKRFSDCLKEGERLVGEWLAQAHSTRYTLHHAPWVVFDLMQGTTRQPFASMMDRVSEYFVTPRVLSADGPCDVETMLHLLEPSGHGAVDPVEGAVWRVERRGAVDFLAKFVRPDKVDGIYLPEISGLPAVWNWRP